MPWFELLLVHRLHVSVDETFFPVVYGHRYVRVVVSACISVFWQWEVALCHEKFDVEHRFLQNLAYIAYAVTGVVASRDVHYTCT